MKKLNESGVFWIQYGALLVTVATTLLPTPYHYPFYGLLWAYTALYAFSALALLKADVPYKLPADWAMPKALYVGLIAIRTALLVVTGFHWLAAFTAVCGYIHAGRWPEKTHE